MTSQQADIFKRECRDLLCTGPEEFPEAHRAGKYPSPEQLQYKIIVKHKKLNKGDTEVVQMNRDDNADEDLSDAILNGFLRVQEIDGTWTRNYFVLTADKMTYADSRDFDDKVATELEDLLDEDVEVIEAAEIKATELHFTETWFHGELQDGTEKPNG